MGDGENVIVAVRVRPFNDREKSRKVSFYLGNLLNFLQCFWFKD